MHHDHGIVKKSPAQAPSGTTPKLAAQRKLLNNLKWAAEQGAKTLKRENDDVAEAIYKVIKEENITTVVIGRPKSTLLKQLLGRNHFKNLLSKLENEDTDVVIVA